MKLDGLVLEIDQEIERLTQARKLLSGTSATNHEAHPNKLVRQRRKMSAAGRKRIAEAQKARWAAAKKKAAAK